MKPDEEKKPEEVKKPLVVVQIYDHAGNIRLAIQNPITVADSNRTLLVVTKEKTFKTTLPFLIISDNVVDK